jgi:hypothetical protein
MPIIIVIKWHRVQKYSCSMNSLSPSALALKNASKDPPGPEKIVLGLCPLIEKVLQPHKSGNGVVLYQVQRCPRGDYCKTALPGHTNRGKIKFKDLGGYFNPLRHILSSCFANDTNAMYNAYWESQVGKKKQALLANYMSVPNAKPKPFQLLNKKDYALSEWIDMIVMENWAILTVENERYRKVLKHTFEFLIKTVGSVILAMTCAVDEILAAEIKAACRGSIVHDA